MVLSAKDLHFSYGPQPALLGVSFDIPAGGVVALLGPNGAGKSTLSRIIAGVQKPTSGTLRVLEHPAFSLQARASTGVTPQEIDFPKFLKVEEILNLVRSHYPEPEELKTLLEKFGLEEMRGRIASQLSGGQRRRLAVACSFAGRPKLVVLDEPTTGLDVESRRILWDSLQSFTSRGGTVLLTTHYLDEVEALSQRVIVIDQGRILYDGGVAELKNRIGLRRIRFRSSTFIGKLDRTQFAKNGQEFSTVCLDSDTLVQHLIQEKVEFRDLEVTPVSLEEAFLSLVSKEIQ